MSSVRAIALAALASAASAARYSWPMDGGSAARLNFAEVGADTRQPATHSTHAAVEPIEDTSSQIEGYLLNSMLVTSNGNIVIASDDCEIWLGSGYSKVSPS